MPVSDYTPTVEAVAALLRSRTKTPSGSEAGTFMPAASAEQDSTRPTAEQAAEMIAVALQDIVGVFGPDVPDAPGEDPGAYRTAVQGLSALGAALQVELTYFPEQVATGRSPYAQLKQLYDDRLKRLTDAIIGDEDGGSDGPTLSDPYAGMPSGGGFPNTAIGMEHPW